MEITSGIVLVIATVGYVIITAFMYLNLRQQTAYIARQTDAGEAQMTAAKVQADTARVSMMQTVFNLMELSRPSRTALRVYVNERKKRKAPTDEIPFDTSIMPDIEEHASNVCRAFDLLGFLDRHHYIPQEIVDEFYAPPLVLLWGQVLGTYVDALRKPISEGGRGLTHFWELAELYKRVKCVEQNHPGIKNLSEWPKNPRECK